MQAQAGSACLTQDERYRRLTEQLLVFEGEFDESTGRGDYRVLAQDPPA